MNKLIRVSVYWDVIGCVHSEVVQVANSKMITIIPVSGVIIGSTLKVL